MSILRRFSRVFAGLATLVLSLTVGLDRGTGSFAFKGLARLGNCGSAGTA